MRATAERTGWEFFLEEKRGIFGGDFRSRFWIRLGYFGQILELGFGEKEGEKCCPKIG
jgi:hypothetical protein